MAIPNRQIGWSTKSNLLWQISKQLERLAQVAGNVYIGPQGLTGGWSLVTGGEAGDGTVAQYSPTGFNITGPDDSNDNGWVYIKQYFPYGATLTIDYQWACTDNGTGNDWPIYAIDETEPTGIPSDLTVRVNNTPESDTWNITVDPGKWFSVGIYSNDSCCGKGFLSVDILNVWTFVSDEISIFPANSNGYTLYTGNWTNYDDGQTTGEIPFAGEFLSNNISDTKFILSTNGYLFGVNSEYDINANSQDLYLTPGGPLDDGDIQNFWYKNNNYYAKWKTSALVYCGHYNDETVPYSYILNVYRDGQYQYVEACCKTNVGGDAGPNGFVENSSIATQVWQSDLDGTNWTYLGYGSIV
jgi:hypothetical protein